MATILSIEERFATSQPFIVILGEYNNELAVNATRGLPSAPQPSVNDGEDLYEF